MRKRPPLTRREIIDLIISRANERFTGDKRDGDPQPITVQNFHDASYRLGVRALRARLSRLSLAELANEAVTALDHDKTYRERLSQIEQAAEHHEREEASRALRQRQAELGRRPREQAAILAAARHYRSLNNNAKQAWHAIKKQPYQTGDGETVLIEDDKMRVRSRAQTQRRSPIKFAQWQKRYWIAAKRISS